jgi:hypothetical protein
MNHTVFISHSVKDKDQEAANRVYDYLERNGIKCFMDTKDLVPGKPYPEQITSAIGQSRVLVLVFSSNSDSSDAVQNELAIARNGRITIIPLRIENVMPERLAFFISTPQWLDAFAPPLDRHLPRLVDAIKQHICEQQEEAAASDTPPATGISSKPTSSISQSPSAMRLIKFGTRITDHKWHDIDDENLRDWVKKRKDKLDKGEEIVGRVFRYRRNWNTGRYQLRLRDQYKSNMYEE